MLRDRVITAIALVAALLAALLWLPPFGWAVLAAALVALAAWEWAGFARVRPGRPLRVRRVSMRTGLLILAVVMGLASDVGAWGEQGHRAMAEVATLVGEKCGDRRAQPRPGTLSW